MGRNGREMDERAASIKAYRKRAQEARAEAETFSNVHVKKRMLEIADNYDLLARALKKENRAMKR